MAQLEIGSLNPLNVDDNLLNTYKQRVQGGEDVDTVIKDFTNTLATQVRNAGDIGSSTGEDFIKTLGFRNGGAFSQFLSASEAGTGAYEALKANFTNTQAPTMYTPGSLQQGQTPQVVAGTQQPPNQSGQPQDTTLAQRQQGGQPTAQQQQQNQVADQAYQQRLAQIGGQTAQGGGQVAPPSISSQSYTVQTGDSLSKIASRMGVGVQDISGFRSGNPNVIYPGEVLTVKKMTGNAPTTSGFSMDQIKQQASMTPEQNLQVEQSKIPDNLKQALASKGVTADDDTLTNLAQVSPTKFVTDLYQEIYKNAGLSDIKKQFEDYNKEINDITTEMNDKIVDVNNDPWLTEGVRLREAQKIQDKYKGRIDSATNSAKYMQTLYDSGLEEARFITQQASTAYNNEIDFQNELYLKALEHGYNMAESEMDLSKPISVGEGNTLYDPVSGKAIFTAPKTFSPTANGLSSREYTALNQITTKFQADPIINLAVKGGTAMEIADQIIANPSSATNQLKSLYVLVKNLDPDSAVREGELALANQTQSYLQQFGNSLSRITQGRVISPQAAVDLANATKELMGAWEQTASSRLQQYYSQANTLGVGSEFQSYISGSNLGLSGNTTNPLGI